LLDATVPPPAVITALQAGGDQFDWVLATAQSERAAGYQLATDFPVMALGGFNGTDPAPTLAQFQRYVGEGRIHYFLAGAAGGGGAGPPGALASPTATTVTQITAWVESHFASTTVGNVSLYDLTAPPAGGSQ
jgi:hypothetical protein